MDTVSAIVRQTPPWVFAILIVLVVTGLQALRTRVVPLWRLFLVPIVFIVWGVVGIVQRSATDPALALDWIGAVAIGAALGWVTTRLRGFSYDRERQSVGMPGSPVPLVRNASIFIARYGLAVLAAFAATRTERVWIVALDVAVAGLATGYFLGWLGRFAPFVRADRPPLMAPLPRSG